MLGSDRVTRPTTAGDAAVDGLGSGIVAGIAMAIYLGLAGLATSGQPADILTRIDPSGQSSALTGVLVHLAVAGVYGTIFGLLAKLAPSGTQRRARGHFVVGGVIYGLILLALAQTVILRGINSLLIGVPLTHLAVAHAIYGLILGTLVGRALAQVQQGR